MLDVLAQIGAVREAVIGDLLLAERLPDLVHVHRHVPGAHVPSKAGCAGLTPPQACAWARDSCSQ